jgi:hypothetical protein
LPNNIGYYYFLFFNSIGMMLTPYPPPSLLLLTPTAGGLMIASRARRRFGSRGWRWRWRQRRWRRTLRWVKKIMRNRAHAEALLIFYSVRKWREIRRAGRRWRRLQ